MGLKGLDCVPTNPQDSSDKMLEERNYYLSVHRMKYIGNHTYNTQDNPVENREDAA